MEIVVADSSGSKAHQSKFPKDFTNYDVQWRFFDKHGKTLETQAQDRKWRSFFKKLSAPGSVY